MEKSANLITSHSNQPLFVSIFIVFIADAAVGFSTLGPESKKNLVDVQNAIS